MRQYITNSIKYVGVDDKSLDLFEGQYEIPNGISYNSYVIMDDKIVVFDTVDKRAEKEWFENIEKILESRIPDYLVISHMESDHGACIESFFNKYPTVKIVGNVKTFDMINKFFKLKLSEENKVLVKEGDILDIGTHRLQFIMAPMIHWPEVMVTYEQTQKVLFSADAFGKFGTLDTDENWTEEAARYYLNIVGKYGVQVQTLIKKLAPFNIDLICPLHGPILKEDIEFYLEKYDIWSSYRAEETGVLIACASIHGNTKHVCETLEKKIIEDTNLSVELMDLTRTDFSLAIRKAFYYDRMIVAASTYNGDVFPVMQEFLNNIKAKNYQNRTVGIIENGAWAPVAAKAMKATLETMKNIEIVEPIVTVHATLNKDSKEQLFELFSAIK